MADNRQIQSGIIKGFVVDNKYYAQMKVFLCSSKYD